MAITNIVSNFKIMANDEITEGGEWAMEQVQFIVVAVIGGQKHKFDGAVHLYSIIHY